MAWPRPPGRLWAGYLRFRCRNLFSARQAGFAALRRGAHLLQFFLRRRSLFVPVVVIVIAGAAPYFCSLPIHERND